MNQRLRLGLIVATVILVLGATGTLFYYKTKTYDTCDKVLEKFDSNHLCLSTSRGVMVFKLNPASGPKAVERIKFLGNEKKFYDGLEIYRVVKDFVVQAGIQKFKQENANITVFDSATQEKLKEFDNRFEVESNMNNLGLTAEEISALEESGYTNNTNVTTEPFGFGDISFANAGPDTNSSELFIVTGKDENSENLKALKGKFTNFGTIVEGQNILEDLNNISVDENTDAPLKKVDIYELRVK